MKTNKQTRSSCWFWLISVAHWGSVFHPCIKQITQKLALLLCWWCRAVLSCKTTQSETGVILGIDTAPFKAVLFIPLGATKLKPGNFPDMCSLLPDVNINYHPDYLLDKMCFSSKPTLKASVLSVAFILNQQKSHQPCISLNAPECSIDFRGSWLWVPRVQPRNLLMTWKWKLIVTWS